jgi:hydrogenase expression/formation protein HypC
MKIITIDGEMGIVEEAGVEHEVSLALLEKPAIGHYVIVHAGYAIEQLDPDEAQETLNILHQAGLITRDVP